MQRILICCAWNGGLFLVCKNNFSHRIMIPYPCSYTLQISKFDILITVCREESVFVLPQPIVYTTGLNQDSYCISIH